MSLILKLAPGEGFLFGEHIKIIYADYQGRRARFIIDAEGIEVNRIRLDGSIVPRKKEEDDEPPHPA